MATLKTPLRSRPYPAESEPPDVAADLKLLALNLDSAPVVTLGTLSSRPVTGAAGDRYLVQGDSTVSNNGIEYVYTGSSWVPINQFIGLTQFVSQSSGTINLANGQFAYCNAGVVAKLPTAGYGGLVAVSTWGTASGTVTIQTSGTDTIYWPGATSAATSELLLAPSDSVTLVAVTTGYWICLSGPNSGINGNQLANPLTTPGALTVTGSATVQGGATAYNLSLNGTSPFINQGACANGAYPASSGNPGMAIGNNFVPGTAEVDFWNLYTGPSSSVKAGFKWWQATGLSAGSVNAATNVMTLDYAGNLSIAGALTVTGNIGTSGTVTASGLGINSGTVSANSNISFNFKQNDAGTDQKQSRITVYTPGGGTGGQSSTHFQTVNDAYSAATDVMWFNNNLTTPALNVSYNLNVGSNTVVSGSLQASSLQIPNLIAASSTSGPGSTAGVSLINPQANTLTIYGSGTALNVSGGNATIAGSVSATSAVLSNGVMNLGNGAAPTTPVMGIGSQWSGSPSANIAMVPGTPFASISTGLHNVAIGANNGPGLPLRSVSTGTYNIGIGASTLSSVTTGGNNVAVGASTLSSATTGNYNAAVGSSALGNLTTATYNTALGALAGLALTSSANVTAIGANAQNSGTDTGTWNYSTAVGYGTSARASGAVAIGVDSGGTAAVATGTNQFVLGTTVHAVSIPGSLSVAGALTAGSLKGRWHYVTANSASTFNVNDGDFVECTAGATVAFPLSPGAGAEVVVKNVFAGTVTINGNGAQVIGPFGGTISTLSQYGFLRAVYDGSAWQVMAGAQGTGTGYDRGSATFAGNSGAGQTTVTVNHNLGVAPTVALATAGGNVGFYATVSSITSTQITFTAILPTGTFGSGNYTLNWAAFL